MSAQPMTDELHIASLVVHVTPSTLHHVEQSLAQVESAATHGSHPDGKLVVTLEGGSADFIMDQIAQIREIQGVINVSLVYQHTEPQSSLQEGIAHD